MKRISKNELVGHKVTRFYVDSDRERITFETDTGHSIIGDCYGDCCSYTWIENVDNTLLSLPATITAVEDLDMPSGRESDHRKDTDYVQYYGLKIVTDRGEIIVDYRNDSNGYYGGDLEFYVNE